MEIVGEISCTVQYQFIGDKEFIDKKLLVGMGFPAKIKDEFSFAELRIPPDQDLDRESITFSNGRTISQGKTFVVGKLDIGNVGISTKVWGSSDIAKGVLDKIVTMIDAGGSKIRLEQQRKRVNHSTQMKARLTIDPKLAFSDKFVAWAEKLSGQMTISDLSKSEAHFPFVATVYVSEPDITKVVERFQNSKELASELEAVSGVRRVSISADTPAEYRDREFDVSIDVDCDRAREILAQLEDTLK